MKLSIIFIAFSFTGLAVSDWNTTSKAMRPKSYTPTPDRVPADLTSGTNGASLGNNGGNGGSRGSTLWAEANIAVYIVTAALSFVTNIMTMWIVYRLYTRQKSKGNLVVHSRIFSSVLRCDANLRC